VKRGLVHEWFAREDRFIPTRTRRPGERRAEPGPPRSAESAGEPSVTECVHALLMAELQAMDVRGRTVCECSQAPWGFTRDLAREVGDAARHVEIAIRLLDHLDGYVGEYPEAMDLCRWAWSRDAASLAAGVARRLDGLARAVDARVRAAGGALADPIVERAMQFVLADEADAAARRPVESALGAPTA